MSFEKPVLRSLRLGGLHSCLDVHKTFSFLVPAIGGWIRRRLRVCVSGPSHLSSCHTDTSRISQQVHHFYLCSLSYLRSEASHHKVEGGGAPQAWCVRHPRPACATLPPSQQPQGCPLSFNWPFRLTGQGREVLMSSSNTCDLRLWGLLQARGPPPRWALSDPTGTYKTVLSPGPFPPKPQPRSLAELPWDCQLGADF